MNNHADVKDIKKVMENYSSGTYEADREKLESVFGDKAVMNGYLGEELLLATPEAFIKDMTESPSMKEEKAPYNSEIEYIRVEGDIATVIVSETGFRGNGSLVNHFHLIKINGKWQIISKLFTTL